MWLQEPGSFTRIMAAMVAPRNTSSETVRPGRVVFAAARTFDEGAEMVCTVAMVRPSNCGDSTAAQGMPQRPSTQQGALRAHWPVQFYWVIVSRSSIEILRRTTRVFLRFPI
jgi:hypothetical protein